MTANLFDAHCHMDVSAPAEPSSAAAAVAGRLLCGVEPSDWDGIAKTAAGWPGTTAAYGLHPWRAGTAPADWMDLLEQRLAADPGAWVGEAGLDAFRIAESPMEGQIHVLREQLRLARRLDRGINLHCVKAWPDLVQLLDAEYVAGGPRTFIVHSFAGPPEGAKALAERGAFFSVGPLFSRRDTPRLRRCAALFPEDRLLLESDAFLMPRRDAAADLLHALSWLAEARGMDVNRAAERIAANSREIFDHG